MTRFDAVLFDAGGVLVLPDPTVLGPLLSYYGGDVSVAAHRRAHYAGDGGEVVRRCGRGRLGGLRRGVRPLGRRARGRSTEATYVLGVTRHAPLWRWAIPEIACRPRSARRGRCSDGRGFERQWPDRGRARPRGLPGRRRCARLDAVRRRQ